MKSILSLIAVCSIVALSGCNSSNKSANMGAVGEKSSCSGSGSGCCKDKAATDAKTGTSMGAVGEKKSGCCSGEKATDAKAAGTSMGAVGDAKPGCCSGAGAAKCPVTGK